MIRTFRHKGLANFFGTGSKAKIVPSHAKRLGVLLVALDRAVTIGDLSMAGSGLHPLTGALDGHWAMTVSGNWRVTFRIQNGDVYDVDYLDYH